MRKSRKLPDGAYIDRDLSWMYFNHRILQEAMEEHVPLLERLTFLGIYSNNLDEFFRVRMATLGRIAENEDRKFAAEREHVTKLIKQINKLNSKYSKEYETAINTLTALLEKENIFLLQDDELDPEQRLFVERYYRRRLSGFISPIWMSSIKSLIDSTDESIYLAVKMRTRAKKGFDYALIALPVAECGRFIRLPDKEGKTYLMYLDDVVRYCLPMIFSGLDCFEFKAYSFKFTKDAEMEIDNDLHSGMLQKISRGVSSRRKGDALRVVFDSSMPSDLLNRVLNKLDLDPLDTKLGGGRYVNHRDLMSFPDCGRKDLKYPSWEPIVKPEVNGGGRLLHLGQDCDRFIHV
ncbi:MAG: RNA degradosome polyphosphate kinase, partial [Prevotella sp.]|nr:RNA degradosome polyphosphate kinase [Prevotella sp.]